MTHKDVIVDFKKEGLVNPPKIEGWPDGWTEYMEPLTHGRASNVTRRFFKDGSGFDFCLDEAMAFSIFAKKGFCLTMWCQYVSPDGLIYFSEIPPEDADWYGGEEYRIVSYNKPGDIPLDEELIALLEEDRRKKGMDGCMFDMYGIWDVMTSVEEEDQAFKIADLMSARSSKCANKKVGEG